MTELNPNVNALIRFMRGSLALGLVVVLIVICILVSVISWNRAERAIDAANQATTDVGSWKKMYDDQATEYARLYKEMDTECRLWQNDVQGLQMDMVEAGIELKHGKKQ